MEKLKGLFNYIRWHECAQMTVPGIVGILSYYSIQQLFTSISLIYLFGLFFHLLFVYTFNDWCDFYKDQMNPRKSAVGHRRRNILLLLAALFLCGSIFLLSLTPLNLFLSLMCLTVLWLVYSFIRNRIIMFIPYGELLHFISGVCYFLSGIYLYVGQFKWVDLLGAMYFGMIYLAGGLLNELIDKKFDKEFGMNTLAISVGVKRTFGWFCWSQICAVFFLNFYCNNLWVLLISIIGSLAYFKKVLYLKKLIDDQSHFLFVRLMSRISFSSLTLVLIIHLLFFQ